MVVYVWKDRRFPLTDFRFQAMLELQGASGGQDPFVLHRPLYILRKIGLKGTGLDLSVVFLFRL